MSEKIAGMPELGRTFDRDGFVVVPHLFSVPEANTFKAEIKRILDAVRAEMQAAGNDPAQALRTGVFVGLAARSEFFRQAVRDVRLLDRLQAIMGPHIEFLSDKVVYKTPPPALPARGIRTGPTGMAATRFRSGSPSMTPPPPMAACG